jgi:glucose/arabinose dehydrogenase
MPRVALIAFVLLAFTAAPSSAADDVGTPEPWLTNVRFPSNMAWSADGRLFFDEKDTGDVRVVQDGRLLPDPFLHLDVQSGGEMGLLGIALHPDFPDQPWVYVYFSSAADQRNEVARFRADGNTATDMEFMIDGLELRGIHNGGDLAFGTDGTLFITIGEAAQPDRAQNANDLGGKVLRLDADGTIPADNPFGDSPVYSIGHRNSFGICVDPANGDVWETENGPTSDDEVNRIEAGANYGWPLHLGSNGPAGFVDPVLDYPTVIVPTGCAVWNGALYFGAFDGIVRRLELPPGDPARDEEVANVGSGITDLEVGPDGALYVATVDTIYRMAGPTSSETPTSTTTIPAPTNAAPAADGGGGLPIGWIALGLAVVTIGGLAAARLGRRRG